MKGLAAKAEDRFSTAREMCLALSGCGVSEAPALAVGEWVEGLAAGALADRTAKITAIETNANLKVHSLSSFRPGAISSAPPGPPPPGAASALGPSDRPPRSEQSPDALTITMNTGIIRMNSRVRVAGTAAAAAAVLLAGVLLSVRSTRQSPAVDSTKPSVLASGGSAAVAPPNAESQLVLAPASTVSAPAPALVPGPGTELAPPTAASSARQSGFASPLPARRPATAASPGKSGSTQRPKEGSGSDVFDSRE
jgi:hypothetical protein